MGFDNHSNEFHSALVKLATDTEPIVRRNAALALVRFNDAAGHDELVAVLKSYAVKSPATGLVSSTLRQGSDVSRGTLLARVQQADGLIAEVRSPLPGKIEAISKANSSHVTTGEEILRLNSDEESVWEALRGLSFIGTNADLETVQAFTSSSSVTERVREQAKLTAKAIGLRR
jgi:biotin carboxyl carrier protein